MSTVLGQEGTVRTTSFAAESRRVRLVLLRNVVLAMVIIAVVGVALEEWISPPDPRARRPSTFSTRADGFRGALEVAEQRGYAVSRNLDSFGALPQPASESVLVIIDPLPALSLATQGVDLGPSQVRAISRWVEAGGHLIVALPGRSAVQVMHMEVDTSQDLETSADLLPALLGEDPPPSNWRDAEGWLTGRLELEGLSHPLHLLAHDDAARVSSYLRRGGDAGEILRFIDPADSPVQLVAFESDPESLGDFEPVLTLDGDPLVLGKDRGEGRVWLVSTSYPFTNMAFKRGGTDYPVDVLLYAASEAGRRRVIFDEYTHGLWNREGIGAVVMNSDLRYPALAAVLLAVVLGWRGSVRLGAPKPQRTVSRRAKEEFVISLADLAERAGRHRAAARWLHDAHRGDLPPLLDANEGDVDPLQQQLDSPTFTASSLVAFAAALRRVIQPAGAARPHQPDREQTR